jgi:outer membrane protein assembly factor BamE (lipoprotein component of BamABCDE complex)
MLIARVMAFALLVSLSACGGFDKEKWASGKGNYSGKNPRTDMVSDAEAAGVKVGATRAQVRDLLGAPDYTTLDVYYNEKAIVTKIGSTQS